jgi:putative transcriptional regulator
VAIAVKLDDLLHDRRMTLTELADRLGMTLANLLRFEPEQSERARSAVAGKRSASR